MAIPANCSYSFLSVLLGGKESCEVIAGKPFDALTLWESRLMWLARTLRRVRG